MAAELEILGVTTTTDTGFEQSKEDVVDVSQYTEVSVFLTVYALDRNSGTTTVAIQTAVDNDEDRYLELATLATLAADPGSYPATYNIYLSGPGEAGTNQPGFARYLRVTAEQASGASITMDVRGIFKSPAGMAAVDQPTQMVQKTPVA